MATGDKYPVLMASQLGSANGPAQLNSSAVLPVNQGGTGEGNTQAALLNLGAGPNSNLIDNGFFLRSQFGLGSTPINQRGQTTYTASASYQYVIDRWWMYQIGASLTIDENGISCTSPSSASGAYASLGQQIDQDFSNKTVTLSCLVNSNFYTATTQIPSIVTEGAFITKGFGNGALVFRYTNTRGFFVELRTTRGQTNVFQAVKLEEGPSQTLAYQNSNGIYQILPQSYKDELYVCQTYQLVTSNIEYLRANYVNANSIYFVFPTPATLRINPTFSGTMQIIDFVSGEAQTGFTFSCYAYPGEIHIAATKTSHGLTDATLIIPAGVFDANLH